MSGGGSQTVTQDNSPPSFLMPYYTSALQQIQGLDQSGGPQYYPGQTVAPLNAEQNQGVSMLTQAAQNGSAPIQAAQQANEFMTSGALQNLSQNPYLQSVYNTSVNSGNSALASQFGGTGAMSQLNTQPLQANNTADYQTSILSPAYENGLNQTNAAVGQAANLDQAAYLPSQALQTAGAVGQQQNQNDINAAVSQYNFNQQAPYNLLSYYSNLVNELGGQSKNTSSTSTTSAGAMGVLGGAASGAALGTAIFPGIGTAIGAGLGAIVGGT